MEEINAVTKDIILKDVVIQTTPGDLIKRLRNLIDVSELVKKYHILPENAVPKRNPQKFLRGPI